MGFPRYEYWSGLPFPSLGDVPDPGIEPTFPALHADSLPLSQLASPVSVDICWEIWHLLFSEHILGSTWVTKEMSLFLVCRFLCRTWSLRILSLPLCPASCCSAAYKSCPTLCDPVDFSTRLPSNHLILCRPLLYSHLQSLRSLMTLPA